MAGAGFDKERDRFIVAEIRGEREEAVVADDFVGVGAEICISDQPVDFNDPSLIRSRAAATRKNPKLIFVHSVKWITDRPLDKKVPYMIVTDNSNEYRPSALL